MISNRIAIATILIVASCLSGCSYMAKSYLPEPVFTGTSNLTGSFTDENGFLDIKKYQASKTTTNAAAARSQLVTEALFNSNAKCELHKATIMSNSNNVNLFAGSASLLFSGYATVVDSVQTAKSASALATLSTGMQGQINQEIYQSKLSTAIFKAIDLAREKQEVKMRAVAASAAASDIELILEISKYHDKCSLLAALTEITDGLTRVDSPNQIAEKNKVIAEILKDLRETKLTLGTDAKSKEWMKEIDDQIITLELQKSKLVK